MSHCLHRAGKNLPDQLHGTERPKLHSLGGSVDQDTDEDVCGEVVTEDDAEPMGAGGRLRAKAIHQKHAESGNDGEDKRRQL